eukprot:549212-Prorocentrum_lima.AAC.1
MRASSEAEGFNFDARELLTEAAVAKICLTTGGQYTPIQATLGYQPALLLDAGRGEAHSGESMDD